jgi:hypothetical protein
LELVSLNRETRFAFVDNPPRRRERAGDLFVINARLRDTSNRPAGRVHASFAETQPPPRVVAQGSGTFILPTGQIMVSGPIMDQGRNDRTDHAGGGGRLRRLHRSARNPGDHRHAEKDGVRVHVRWLKRAPPNAGEATVSRAVPH